MYYTFDHTFTAIRNLYHYKIMKRFLGKLLLKMTGFKIEGEYPYHIPKKILAVVPHTSWWDFFLGLFVRASLGAKIQFVAKDSLFFPPLGWIMKALGGIPVDRSKRNNFVDAVADIYTSRDELAIAIAPEGTRKKVEKFKTGFYHIARAAKIPIVPVKFDYLNKAVHFGTPFFPGEDSKADILSLQAYFKGVQGRNAELSYE